MARSSKLLTALDAHRGRDYAQERQRKKQKLAEKRKRSNSAPKFGFGNEQEIETDINGVSGSKQNFSLGLIRSNKNAPDGLQGENDMEIEAAADATSLSDESSGEGASVAFSDVSSATSQENNVIAHQKLTVNNIAALEAAHKSLSVDPSFPFTVQQTIVTPSNVAITDVNDDLARELAFYRQCLDAAMAGRAMLRQDGVAFSRPKDFFAEMIKNDDHMTKIRKKLVDDAASRQASHEAKKQRELKKMGKQIQIAKEKERSQEKRATLDKVKLLRQKRRNTDANGTHEDDAFDVALEDPTKDVKRRATGRQSLDGKRKQKDQKFGFGGKKRHSKSGDAFSSGDVSAYSSKKAKKPWVQSKRPGKARRAKT